VTGEEQREGFVAHLVIGEADAVGLRSEQEREKVVPPFYGRAPLGDRRVAGKGSRINSWKIGE
jgi:hypothetical protein